MRILLWRSLGVKPALLNRASPLPQVSLLQLLVRGENVVLFSGYLLYELFIKNLCSHAKHLMHIAERGGVKEHARQTGNIQEPAACLIDGAQGH